MHFQNVIWNQIDKTVALSNESQYPIIPAPLRIQGDPSGLLIAFDGIKLKVEF